MTSSNLHHLQTSSTATAKDRKTMSLLLSRFGSKVRLTSAAPTPGLKGILKVKTLEESLRSCVAKNKCHLSKRRSSITNMVSVSIRSLFVGTSAGSPTTAKADSNRRVSHDTGLAMLRNAIQEDDDPTATSGRTSTTIAENSSIEMVMTKEVRFSTLERRLYSVAPSENPGLTGSGPALELDGWTFGIERPRSIDDYEKERGPRKTMEDLKLSMMDRQDRLKEHGASQREIQLFANRVKKAKIKRAQTVEAFTLYGKQHLLREEQRENTKRWFQKLFRLRKDHEQEQVALWEQAQKSQQQQQQQTAQNQPGGGSVAATA